MTRTRTLHDRVRGYLAGEADNADELIHLLDARVVELEKDQQPCGPCQLRDHAGCDSGGCACGHTKAKRTDAERVQVVIRRMRQSWTATDEEREMTDDEWADAHPIGPEPG